MRSLSDIMERERSELADGVSAFMSEAFRLVVFGRPLLVPLHLVPFPWHACLSLDLGAEKACVFWAS